MLRRAVRGPGGERRAEPSRTGPSQAEPSRAEPSRRLALALCGLLVAGAGALRALPLASEFWLDEIWTWSYARGLHSPLGVFTAIHHSNNHHLNTLLFQLLGEREHWAVYRIPALLSGTAAVALAAALAWRTGRLEAVLAAFLCGGSFALVHFSSEARGYAPAVAFALAAQLALERDLEAPRRGAALLFAACCTLGFLSHLFFGFYYAGAAVQSGWRLLGSLPTGRAAVRLTRLHALPLLALGLLYAVDLRHMAVGTGPEVPLDVLVARTAGFALGLPIARPLAPAHAIAATALLVLALWPRLRRRDPGAAGFGVAIVAAPLAALAWLAPEVIAVRYFLVGIALFLVLQAELAAAALRRGGVARAAALVLLAVFTVGNAVRSADFVRLGRGGFQRALQHMATHTHGRAIRVTGDSDFRLPMILGFYARLLPGDRQLVYYPRRAPPAGEPEWRLRHAGRRPARLAAAELDPRGRRWVRVAEFDHAAISGFWCALYRRAGSGPGVL